MQDDLARLKNYLRVRREKPLRSTDDTIHGLHIGEEQWECELRLSDLVTTMATLEAQARENADLRNDLDAHRNQSAMREVSKAQSEAWLEETRAERDAALEEVARSEKHRNDLADKITAQSVELGSIRAQLTAANAKIAALTDAGEKLARFSNKATWEEALTAWKAVTNAD